eukprot:3568113-Rhodomonas_salina.1
MAACDCLATAESARLSHSQTPRSSDHTSDRTSPVLVETPPKTIILSPYTTLECRWRLPGPSPSTTTTSLHTSPGNWTEST